MTLPHSDMLILETSYACRVDSYRTSEHFYGLGGSDNEVRSTVPPVHSFGGGRSPKEKHVMHASPAIALPCLAHEKVEWSSRRQHRERERKTESLVRRG